MQQYHWRNWFFGFASTNRQSRSSINVAPPSSEKELIELGIALLRSKAIHGVLFLVGVLSLVFGMVELKLQPACSVNLTTWLIVMGCSALIKWLQWLWCVENIPLIVAWMGTSKMMALSILKKLLLALVFASWLAGVVLLSMRGSGCDTVLIRLSTTIVVLLSVGVFLVDIGFVCFKRFLEWAEH